MASIDGIFECGDTTGTLYFKIRYRLAGETVWASFNIPTSGTTFSFTPTNNLIYDTQVVNVGNVTNEASAIVQQCAITDPSPILSPANTSLAYTFSNLSTDMDTYTCTVAEYSTPGSIISTHILPAVSVVTDTFTGLDPLTQYILSITPAANQFTRTFTYIFTTESVFSCADPSGTTATLT
jgi:hypothetical protein